MPAGKVRLILLTTNIQLLAILNALSPNHFVLVDSCIKGVSSFKDDFPEYYWQLVSNACIINSKHIEMIVYMPYERDLKEIRDAADNYDGLDQYKYRFISELPWYNLACLPNDSDYKDLNIFRFEPIDGDKS